MTKRGTNPFHGGARLPHRHEDLALGNIARRARPLARVPGPRARAAATASRRTTTSRSRTTASTSAARSSRTSCGSGAPTASRTSGWSAPRAPRQDDAQGLQREAELAGHRQRHGIGLLVPGRQAEVRPRAGLRRCVEPHGSPGTRTTTSPTTGSGGFWKIEVNHVFSPNFFLTAKSPTTGRASAWSPRRPGRRPCIAASRPDVRHLPDVPRRAPAAHRQPWTAATSRTGWAATTRSSSAAASARRSAAQPRSERRPAGRLRQRHERARARAARRINQTFYWSAYLGDTFSKDRLTLNVGVRWDQPEGEEPGRATLRSNVTFPEFMPGAIFEGNQDNPINLKEISPRLGLSYSLDESRRTVVRASFARYDRPALVRQGGGREPRGSRYWPTGGTTSTATASCRRAR